VNKEYGRYVITYDGHGGVVVADKHTGDTVVVFTEDTAEGSKLARAHRFAREWAAYDAEHDPEVEAVKTIRHALALGRNLALRDGGFATRFDAAAQAVDRLEAAIYQRKDAE
jgi:hypothetical protein